MFAKPSTNRGDAPVRAERSMPQEPQPLSNDELEQLVKLLADRSNRAGRDVLAFSGASSVAGIVTKIMIADPPERSVLLIAIRRALAKARGQV